MADLFVGQCCDCQYLRLLLPAGMSHFQPWQTSPLWQLLTLRGSGTYLVYLRSSIFPFSVCVEHLGSCTSPTIFNSRLISLCLAALCCPCNNYSVAVREN